MLRRKPPVTENEDSFRSTISDKNVGLELNAENTTYMFLSHQRSVELNYNVKKTDKLFQKLVYFGKILSKQNCINEVLSADEIQEMFTVIRLRIFIFLLPI
jgi:hypothetical protein